MGSKPPVSIRLSAKQRAIEVSSVHSPGARSNGPPPAISSILLKEPGARNSRVVPSASPVARPSKAPRYLSLGSMIIQWKDARPHKYASVESAVARLPQDFACPVLLRAPLFVELENRRPDGKIPRKDCHVFVL